MSLQQHFNGGVNYVIEGLALLDLFNFLLNELLDASEEVLRVIVGDKELKNVILDDQVTTIEEVDGQVNVCKE